MRLNFECHVYAVADNLGPSNTDFLTCVDFAILPTALWLTIANTMAN